MRLCDINCKPVSDFTRLLEDEQPFCLSNWGLDEWRLVLDLDYEDHHHPPRLNFKDFVIIGQQLRHVLNSRPTYLMAMPTRVLTHVGVEVDRYLQINRLEFDWIDGDVFHNSIRNASMYADDMHKYLLALRRHRTLVVGPAHACATMKELLGCEEYVTVPHIACYADILHVIETAVTEITAWHDPAIVTLSCGSATPIVLDAIHREIGKPHTLIDMGAVWDAYSGIPSRPYMRALFQEGWRPPH